MIQTNYNSESKIISTNYIGKIDANEIIEYFGDLNIEGDFKKDLLYIDDHTQAEFDFKALDIKQIVHALYDKIIKLNSIRVAVVNTKPKETAYSLIAIRLLRAKNMHAKAFCTKEAAQDWLLLKKVVSNL